MILESARNHCLAMYNQSQKNRAKHRIFKIIHLCSMIMVPEGMTKQQNCEDIVAKRCVVVIVVVVVVVVAIVFVFVIIIIIVVVVVVVINLFCCH